MLARSLRFGLIGLVLTGLTWFAVVLWWQSSPHVVSIDDVLLGFVALPVAVCVSALVGWLLWRRLSAPLASPAVAASEPIATAATRLPEALVLSVGVSTAEGEYVDTVLEVIASGEARPEPDADYLDAEGMPVRLKRATELQLDEVEDWLGETADGLSTAFKRALALLPAAIDPVLRDLVEAMPPPVSVHAAPRALPVLVRALIPMDWTEPMTACAQRWIEHRIALFWPEALPPVRLTAAGGGADAQTEVGAWLRDAAQMRSLLLVAFDSAADQAAVDVLVMNGELFRHDRPEGRVPGEAAAAVLLSRPGMTLGIEPLARLRLPILAARETASRAGGRIDSGVIEKLLAQSLEAAGCDVDQVASVVCDGDVRPTRGVEIASAMSHALAHLDPVTDRIGLGTALGDLGSASATLALALAASHTRTLQKPVVLSTLADSIERSLSLLQPYTPEPATA